MQFHLLKNPHLPHGMSLEIPRGRGCNILEAKYDAKISWGTGDAKQEKPSMGGVHVHGYILVLYSQN